MKKLFIAIVGLLTITAFAQCSSKDKGDDGPCSETQLQVTTTPANGSVTPPQVGGDFLINVNITNGFPATGAKINVLAKNEVNNQVVLDKAFAATAGINNITITGTPVATSVVVQVSVVSNSCAENTWTGTLRYSRK
ncbi:hypothetical protein HHL16_03115 [Pseudoflavitalea sp. G-6-1-2]|uniref:hypothetical protein n=1 Tax=Pseudoflavitalea sp. G-6-1-2 TaxID=2728841 RepID=UPI00146F4B97|nr:hypothetical protein [Pseudoflavitalea sp. G-6-1-2]NML19844.1 hypothetical protein [Pseudoflavitalea sp. G-6-1-2]